MLIGTNFKYKLSDVKRTNTGRNPIVSWNRLIKFVMCGSESIEQRYHQYL